MEKKYEKAKNSKNNAPNVRGQVLLRMFLKNKQTKSSIVTEVDELYKYKYEYQHIYT